MDIAYKTFPTKSELYAYVHGQVRLIAAETADLTAILANTAALLAMELEQLNWAGFYLLKDGRLILGPFQGKPAVAEIGMGNGVCGTAAVMRATQLVENVHSCCNHISCDAATNYEIVVPILLSDGSLFGVIDLDSPILSRFDAEDRVGLEKTAQILAAIVSDPAKV